MEHNARLDLKRFLRAACACLMPAIILALATVPALAADEAPAKALLLKMANFLAKAPAFSVTMRSGYDAIQEDGQVIEFGERRRILLQRPDRVRIEVERSDGDQGLVIFDGKGITVFKADDNLYARAEQPGTLDEAVVYLVKDLQMTLPLARMFRSDLPQDLEQQVTTISYVEENFLFDVPTDHLAVRSADVDLQIWIAQGEQPLPRRVILTYRNAPGQPQFRADFLDWSLSPGIPADSFTFIPPADAEQIPFIARVHRKGSIPAQQGGRQ